jgi:protein-S-isoprenylcysteine O-methyltransferase Ste14
MFPESNLTLLRFARWAIVTVVLSAVIFGLSGRWLDPWLWAYVGIFSAAGFYAAVRLTDDVARERFRPPEAGADRVWLKAIRLVAFAHVVVGALDVGRWHLTTSVPTPLRFAGSIIAVVSVALVFHSMFVNRFFSPVVRIQSERGHRVIDFGPDGVIRHPGYAGMIPAIPASALVLGSWLGVALAVVFSLLMLRRVVFEDAFLTSHLDGYAAYASRVRYRLVPGIW